VNVEGSTPFTRSFFNSLARGGFLLPITVGFADRGDRRDVDRRSFEVIHHNPLPVGFVFGEVLLVQFVGR
jgi:hypothetical protein